MKRPLAVLASVALAVVLAAPLVSLPAAQASDSTTPTSTTGSAGLSGSAPDTADPSSFALTISPTRLVVGPGDVGAPQPIKVINGGSVPLAVTVQKRNFVGRPDGTLDFQEDAPYAASEWVHLDVDHFDIAPGATQVVDVSIVVPPDSDAGDHQVALVFLVPASQTSDNVKINRGIAIPAYVSVGQPVDDSAAISDLHAPWLTSGGPVTVTAKVHSTGTVHRDFRADRALQLSADGSSAGFPDFTVVRGGSRDITTAWKPPLMCICHPTVSFVNADGSLQTVTVQVIVFPFVLAAIILVLLLAGLVAILVRRRRRSRARTFPPVDVFAQPDRVPVGTAAASEGDA